MRLVEPMQAEIDGYWENTHVFSLFAFIRHKKRPRAKICVIKLALAYKDFV